MSAAFIAHGDLAPIFEIAKHVFDFMAFFIELCVVSVLDFAVLARRNAGCNAQGQQLFPKGFRVIATVSGKGFGLWKNGKEDASSLMIAHLSFGEQQNKRFTVSIGDSMQFGV